jgi:hypothetical protein
VRYFTLNTSNHPDALASPISEEAWRSWDTFYCGPIESLKVAKKMADVLAGTYKHVRLFSLTRDSGRLLYEI